MKFTNIIEAIKAIRSVPVVIELTTNDRNEQIMATRIGLKDSKDLVEAIMEFGRTNGSIHLESLRAENLRLNEQVNELNEKLGKIREITYPDYPRNSNDDIQF